MFVNTKHRITKKMSENMPFFSIIIPVYKVEKYLDECIQSVLSQSFTDFEVILVDDGSPDNCPKMCDEYAQKDKRIRVIHKENGGVSSARNMGLDIAKGEYIWFVDSDDFIENDSLQKLFSVSEKEKPDAVCFGYKEQNKDGNSYPVVSRPYMGATDKQLNLSIMFAGIVSSPNTGIDIGPVTKIFSGKIIEKNNLRFDETVRTAEDLLFTSNYFLYTENITVLSDCLYYYRYNDTSLSKTKKNTTVTYKGVERSVYIITQLGEYLKKAGWNKSDYFVPFSIRLNRIVIDSAEHIVSSEQKFSEKIKNIKTLVNYFDECCRLYEIKAEAAGTKGKIEQIIINRKMSFAIYLYSKLMEIYHNKNKRSE